MKRYCFKCASLMGYVNPTIPDNLFNTDYQLEKFIKHTSPHRLSNGVHSIFSTPSTSTYRDYIVSAISSGYVETDDYGRTNICWVGSSDTGTMYKDGMFYLPANSVKVVLHDDIYRIHAFPISHNGMEANYCIKCGKPIL